MRTYVASVIVTATFAYSVAHAQCPGDANNNGFVNFADYGSVAMNFGTSCIGVPYCGDGIVDLGEDCDQENVGTNTCQSEGFVGGTITCGADCVIDTSSCYSSRFVDNGDGTITDNQTGLMWEKKVKFDRVEDFANLHDADNAYPWSGWCALGDPNEPYCQPDATSEETCLAGVQGDNYGCAQCASGRCEIGQGGTVWQWVNALNAANFAGYADWRLPTAYELFSIVDPVATWFPVVDAVFHGASCGGTCTDANSPACSCTNSDSLHVSRTTDLGLVKDYAVLVSFGGVFVGGARKIRGHAARAVRERP